MEALRQVSGGDMRKAIMFLQSSKQLYGPEELTAEAVVDIAGVLPFPDAERLWRSIQEPRFDDIRGVVRASKPVLGIGNRLFSVYCDNSVCE